MSKKKVKYEPVDGATRSLVEAVAKEHHPELWVEEPKFDLLFAHSEKAGQPAIKLRGWRCHATIRQIPLRDRAKGYGDLEIIIDGDHWPDWTDEQRRALIDHELCHMFPTGERDDCGRPKFKVRLHDYELVGFTEVVERHGANSFEAMSAQAWLAGDGQFAWKWAPRQTRAA